MNAKFEFLRDIENKKVKRTYKDICILSFKKHSKIPNYLK